MKRIITLFVVGIMFLFTSDSFSQVKTTYTSTRVRPPSFTVEMNFSYSLPLPNLRGEMGEQFTFKNYGVKFGVGSELMFKLTADKKGKSRPYLSLGYDLFLNSDDSKAYLPNNVFYVWPDTTTNLTPVSGKSNMYLHIFHVGLGYEYDFVSKSKWIPYVNLGFDLNYIFGTYKQTPTTGPGTQFGEISFTYKSAARFGLGAGVGVNGRITRAFGINIGLKYKFPNLLAKDTKVSTVVNKFEINDKEDSGLGVSKDRHMMYLQFQLGAVFFMGKK